jgi:fucose permease
MNRKPIPTRLILIAYFAFITISMPFGMLNIAWTYMQGTFGVSLDSLGLLLSASTIGHIVTGLLSGRGIDRLGIGPFLLGGALIAGLGMLSFALSPGFGLVLIAAGLSGMGSGMIDTGMNTFVSAHYGTGPMNWLHAFFGVGVTLGPPIITLIVIQWGQSWRWGYSLALALHLIFGMILLMTLRHWRMETDEPAELPKRPATRISDTLRIPTVLFGVLLFAVYGGVEIGTGQLSNTLLVESRGIDPETASLWISAYWGSFTVGRFLIGSVAGRSGNTPLLRLSMMGAVLGAALLWLNFSFVGLVLIGFSLAPMFPTLIAETPGRVGLPHAANTIGFQVGVTSLGGALLPGLAGIVAVYGGLEVIGFALLLMALALFAVYELLIVRQARVVPYSG